MWSLLAAAGLVICSVACGTRAPGEAHRSPGTAGSAAAATVGRAGARAGSPLAGSFLMDLTWVSDQRGWALAAAPCGRDLCPRLAATTDGGRTWTALPDPPGRILDPTGLGGCAPAACVSQVRFATPTVGYLFGPALFQTSDGGRSWHRVPSRPVEALEPSAGTVVRVVFDHTGCPGPCDRAVQETTAGSAHWRTLLRIPAGSAGEGVAAQVVRQGTSVIYVLVYGNPAGGAGTAHAVIFRSTDGGRTWQHGPDPCGG
ncbi:MAG TPA: sialidase family protein, partial [Streptosporangiaceae bacterium]|nr:sialidase family protein [Streptosporangiaceae bacterium]